MAGVVGVGQFFSWDAGCMFIGRHASRIPAHAHHAIQIVFGVGGSVRLRPDDEGPWTEYAAAVVPSGQPHALDATGTACAAILLVEPETREGRTLAELYPRGGIVSSDDGSLSEAGPALLSAWLDGRDRLAVVGAVRQVLRAITRGVEPAVISDARILRAVSYVAAHLDGPIALREVAADACLSPSRFRHLFVEQTGMALRPYILWRRLLLVWERVMAGESLAAAAHSAGFADSAHLARTSRRMLGVAPSSLQFTR